MKKLLYAIVLLPCFAWAINYTNPVKLPEWDHTTGAVKTIDYPHHEIHEGDHFYVAGSTSLANGQICEFIIITPNTTKWTHMAFSYSGLAAFTFVGYENVTVSTTPSVAVTPLNSNRNSSDTSSLYIWKSTGTGTTSSTIVDGLYSYGTAGSPVARSGGGDARESEIILLQNTKYVFRFTNGSDANVINFRANWYEHTND